MVGAAAIFDEVREGRSCYIFLQAEILQRLCTRPATGIGQPYLENQ